MTLFCGPGSASALATRGYYVYEIVGSLCDATFLRYYYIMMRSLIYILLLPCIAGNTADGCINTVAGGATSESSTSLGFRFPAFATALPDGTIILSSENAIYSSQVDGTTAAIAGSASVAGFADGAAAAARFNSPQALVYVPEIEGVLVADYGGHRVRLLGLAGGFVTTLMGSDAVASTGDGGLPRAAALVNPSFLAVSPATGDVFVGDAGAGCVRRAAYGGAALIRAAGGLMSTAAGACGATTAVAAGNTPAPGSTVAAGASLFGVHSGIAMDSDGTLYVSDTAGPWRVDMATLQRVLLVNYVNQASGWANSVKSLTVREDPSNAMTPPGRLLLIAVSTSAFYQVQAVGPLGTSQAPAPPPLSLSVYHNRPNTNSFTGDGTPAINATTDTMPCVFFDRYSRNVYIVASATVAVRAVRPDGIINTVLRGASAAPAGSGDGKLAISGVLNGPRGIAIAPNSDVYFAEASGARVRVLRANGLLGTVAGSGVVGFGGDGGPATAAELNFPYGLMLFPNGDLAIAQSSSGCVRLVSAATGIITTLYGKCGNTTSSGDGGPARAATFASVHSLALDATGGIFVCETSARVIRYINSTTGVINRFAGSGKLFAPNSWTWNASQEGGPALAVDLLYPLVMALSPKGTDLYFTDFILQTVYAVRVGTGILTRVMGIPYDSSRVPPSIPISPNPASSVTYNSVSASGTSFNLGLSGPAVGAVFTGYAGWNGKVISSLLGLAFEPGGSLLVSSSYDNIIMSLNLTSGLASVISGTGRNVRAGDGGSPVEASLFTPRFLAVDAAGNIFFTESGSSVVRQISRGSTPNCPEGYVCTCGLRPVPCTSPSSFCPRGSSSRLPVSPGYMAIAAVDSSDTAVYTAQSHCAVGYFCSGGAAVPCLAGSYGIKAAQVSSTSCVACPIDTYAAVPGAAAALPRPPPCLPVPVGFTSPAGSAFPVACPAFTFRANVSVGRGCAPCAKGTFSPPGAGSCLPFSDDTDTASLVGGKFTFQRSKAVDDGTVTPVALNRLYIVSALPIVGFFAIPLFLLLMLQMLPARLVGPRLHAWYHGLLEDMDLYCAMAHDVGKKESPVNLPTAMGGGISVLFLGAFLAFSVMLIEQFAKANTITALASLELTAFEINAIYQYPSFTSEDDTFDGLLPGGGARAGLVVAVRTAGPQCAAVLPNGTTSFLARGAWEPTKSTFSRASGAAVHVLRCPSCVMDALSELNLQFHPTCASVHLTALTVGGWGTLSLASFSASNVSAVAATLTMSAQSVLDFVSGADPEATGFPVGGRSARGLFLSAFSVDTLEPYNATAAALGQAPPLRLKLRLPGAPLFSRYTMNPSMTILQLLSNLVGNLGVVGGAAVAFSLWLTLQGIFEKRAARVRSEAGKAAGEGERREEGMEDALEGKPDPDSSAMESSARVAPLRERRAGLLP